MESTLNDAPDETWMKIAPMLDGAVGSLREKDRQAILLRFYEGRNLQEVGAALGASPDAAEWLAACQEEMRTWKDLDVYDVVPRPKG